MPKLTNVNDHLEQPIHTNDTNLCIDLAKLTKQKMLT